MKKLYGTKSVNAAAIVSMCWRELSPQEKSSYHKMAADDKFRYYQEKSDYENHLKCIETAMAEKHFTNANISTGLMGRASTRASPSLPCHPRAKASLSEPCEISILPSPRLVVLEQEKEIYVPPYSRRSIALLASRLDDASINFLIKVLK